MLIKVLSEQTNLVSATNVSNATVVRMFNNNSAASVLIKRTDSSDNVIGSFTIGVGETVILEKEPGDKLTSDSSSKNQVLVSKIAFRN